MTRNMTLILAGVMVAATGLQRADAMEWRIIGPVQPVVYQWPMLVLPAPPVVVPQANVIGTSPIFLNRSVVYVEPLPSYVRHTLVHWLTPVRAPVIVSPYYPVAPPPPPPPLPLMVETPSVLYVRHR